MKMTKQVQVMVNSVNEYLKTNHVKNESDCQFVIMTNLLIEAGCYQGFNYYTEDGRLAGTNKGAADHIQFYIG